MAPQKPKDYQSLKKIWYEKLAKSGFVDIEASTEGYQRVRGTRTDEFARQRSMHTWEAKQTYYYMATHFLNEHKFSNKMEQVIWEYHINGLSMRNIGKILSKLNYKQRSKSTVYRTVAKLRAIMKLMHPQIFPGKPNE